MVVAPCKVLLMDEISTGLDSSTAFQIVRALRDFAKCQEVKLMPVHCIVEHQSDIRFSNLVTETRSGLNLSVALQGSSSLLTRSC